MKISYRNATIATNVSLSSPPKRLKSSIFIFLAISPLLPSSPSKDSPSSPAKDAPKVLDIAPNGACDCKACSKMCTADGNLIRPSEDIDERQSANDFEDEIQDFVYIQNPESSIAAEMAKENSRAKRQIEFPDKTEPVPPQQSDRETLRSSSDFYEDAIKADQTRFIITGLRHYTTYAISIRACRQQENEEDSLAVMCSVDSSFYSQTFKQPSNDDIQDFDVETFSNGSSTDVKVFWTPPDNPNGLLLSYQIRHKRIDVEHAQFSSNCLSHNMLNSTRSYLIRGLPPGNYSIDMRATSLAGEGNYTKAKFVYIKESGTNNIWYIFGGLLAIFLISLAILFYAFKRMYLSSISSMKLIANVNPDYAGVTYKQDEWEIPRENVSEALKSIKKPQKSSHFRSFNFRNWVKVRSAWFTKASLKIQLDRVPRRNVAQSKLSMKVRRTRSAAASSTRPQS